MYPPFPTRTDLVQTTEKYRPLRRFHEGGFSKDCRTCIPSSSPVIEISVTDGAVGSDRVSFSGGYYPGFGSSLCSVLDLSTFGPPPVRRFRLTRYLRRITQDDVLLEQEGFGQRLTLPELQEALDERGLYVTIFALLELLLTFMKRDV